VGAGAQNGRWDSRRWSWAWRRWRRQPPIAPGIVSESPFRAQPCHALLRAEAAKRNECSTASARSTSIVGGQHVETSLVVGSHGKNLIHLMLLHFRKELLTLFVYFVRVFFPPFNKFARHPVHLCKWRT